MATVATFTTDYKGYITYPPTEGVKEILLNKYNYPRYRISIGGDVLDNITSLPAQIRDDIIKRADGTVEKTFEQKYTGKKKVFGLPVEIRQIVKSRRLDSIRVRVSGKSHDELLNNLQTVIDGVKRAAGHEIPPHVCKWDREVHHPES